MVHYDLHIFCFFFLHLLFLKQNLNRLSKFSKDKIGDSFLGV